MAGEATDPASVYLQRAIRESADFVVDSEDGTKVAVIGIRQVDVALVRVAQP
jgi:hypothetical protein